MNLRTIKTIIFFLIFSNSFISYAATGEPDPQDKNGLTPLMHALDKQDIKTVQYLLNNTSCNLELKDKEGKNALCHAVITQNPVLIQLVSEKLQEKLLFPKLDPDELDYFPED